MFNQHKFPNKQSDEKIEIFLRRHWLILFRMIGFYILLIVMPIAFYFLLDFTTNIFSNTITQAVFTLGGSLYTLYVLLFFFGSFIDYYLDVWIVTNKRVINIEQKGLFSRTISEKELIRMQDITSEVKGIWETMFDFGTVFLQTAGEKERFVFKQVSHPREVVKKVTKLLEEAEEFERKEEAAVWHGSSNVTPRTQPKPTAPPPPPIESKHVGPGNVTTEDIDKL